jgi:DNA-binding winged helix-turn-helix (wHTH) protein
MLPDRMLEGENPKTPFAQDARHWISVYQRMIVFKGDLLGRLRTQVLTLPKAARADVTENDIGLIQSQLERYERRLVFWYGRQWRLEGLHIDYDSRVLTFQERSVNLTRRELQLLVTLVSRSPNYITAQQLLVQAWRDAKLPEETLRTYIGRLRNKLTDVGVVAVIRNQPRKGYALIFPTSASTPEKEPASLKS